MWKNITNIALVLVVLGLIYFNRIQSKEIVAQENAIEAAKDTLHTFKTKYNSVGGYISVIEGNRKLALELLKIEGEKNKDLIALLDSNKKVMQASKVGTVTNNYYEKDVDTIYRTVNFQDSIITPWITEHIKITGGKLKRSLEYRDEYIYHNDLKDNKGWFTGSTLTTYVEPKNPETKVVELKSVSTVIDKRKPRIGPYVGLGLSAHPEEKVLDITNYKLKPSIQLGIGLTF